MSLQDLDIPAAWRRLDLADLSGVLLVVGDADTGKSTFARYLFGRLQVEGDFPVAYLDGDPGQTQFGPPATLTLTFDPEQHTFSSTGSRLRSAFIGSTTPVGHMLPMVVGAFRLVQTAREAVEAPGTLTIVHDTSGLIDPKAGGLALKLALLDLLQPAAVFAFQREQELEPLLEPLRRWRRTRLHVFQPSPAARRRSSEERRRHRREAYARYFRDAGSLDVPWTQYAVLPAPRFRPGRLMALEDEAGLVLALALVLEDDRPERRITLHTPLRSLQGVDALRVGDVLLDPETCDDQLLR